MIKVDGKNKKVVGLICECNPFHKGHKRLIDEAKKYGDYIVAVMSGNFVQRGEPAVYDKYRRTKELLKNGVDLVIELPVEYVLSSAKYFASAGVAILENLGFVDYIIFGSKIGNIEKLKKLADISSAIENNFAAANDTVAANYLNGNIKKLLKEGKTYSYALNVMLNNFVATNDTVGASTSKRLSSNDILAIEYIKALKNIGSSIEPITIKRKNDLPTASELRKKIKKKIDLDCFSDILTYKLLAAKELSSIYLMTDDFKNAILKTADKNLSFAKRADVVKSKNWTLAYIKRVLLNIVLDIKKNDVQLAENRFDYIRVLGVREKSKNILKEIKIPFLTSFAPTSYKNYVEKYKKGKAVKKDKNSKYFLSKSIEMNIFASDLYNLYARNGKTEVREKLVVV